MIFGLVMAIFAAAGLITDAVNAEKPHVHADKAGARAEFERETQASWQLYPNIGKKTQGEISHAAAKR